MEIEHKLKDGIISEDEFNGMVDKMIDDIGAASHGSGTAVVCAACLSVATEAATQMNDDDAMRTLAASLRYMAEQIDRKLAGSSEASIH